MLGQGMVYKIVAAIAISMAVLSTAYYAGARSRDAEILKLEQSLAITTETLKDQSAMQANLAQVRDAIDKSNVMFNASVAEVNKKLRTIDVRTLTVQNSIKGCLPSKEFIDLWNAR